MKETLKNIFGFITSQPLHKSLRQMRFIAVGAIVFSFYEIHQLISWYKANADLKETGDVAFFAFAGAFVATIWKAIQNLSDSQKSDD